MGILIVAAMGLLAYGLISKTSSDKDDAAPAAMSSASPDAPPFSMSVLGDIVIPDADTCRIVDAGQNGSTLRVTLDGAAECRRLVLIDLASGEITAQIRLAPAP